MIWWGILIGLVWYVAGLEILQRMDIYGDDIGRLVGGNQFLLHIAIIFWPMTALWLK